MSNAILHKYSATAGAVPAAGSLTPRELSINTADGRLFTKTTGGAVQEFARQGKGMTFGNVADAGATVLDWYEEGSSTITVTASVTNPTLGAATKSCKWTRMGNVVFFQLFIEQAITGGSGALFLNGFPYPAVVDTSAVYGFCPAHINPTEITGADQPAIYATGIKFSNGTSYVRLQGSDFSSISCAAVAAYGGTFKVLCNGHYFCA